jgi:molecular chaperone HtpG
VRITYRLTDSPACLVADPSAMSTNLERLLKAAGHKVPEIAAVRWRYRRKAATRTYG